MDPLLAARSKRIRGHIRFQRDVDQEHRRVQAVRERLEGALKELLDVKFVRQARVRADEVTFFASVKFPGKAWIAAGSRAHVEVTAATFKALVEKFTDLISDGMFTGQYPESEFTKVGDV